jgi:hypothetical protein
LPSGERRPGQGGDGVGDELELLFARADRIFGPLAVINIGEQHVPMNDVAGVIGKWVGTELEPSVVPAVMAQPHLILERFPRLDSADEQGEYPGNILRVHNPVRCPLDGSS